MHYPKEYEFRAKKDGMKVIYNTVPYQHIKGIWVQSQKGWYESDL